MRKNNFEINGSWGCTSTVNSIAMLEEMSCSELVDLCRREGVRKTYRHKSDLVERLHEHFGKERTETPGKEFFLFMKNQWKDAKKAGKSRADYFDESARIWQDEENVPVGAIPAHIKAFADLQAVCQTANPGHELLMYYKRGKTAWLESNDSSSGEEDTIATATKGTATKATATKATATKATSTKATSTKATSTKKTTTKATSTIASATEASATKATVTKENATKANATKENATKENATKENATKENATQENAEFFSGSESNYSFDRSDRDADSDDDSHDDSDDDKDDDDSDDDKDDDDSDDDKDGDDSDDDKDGDDSDDEGGEIDLKVSPAGTWENARKIKKATWFKKRKWRRYMETVLSGMPSKDWTMKRFLEQLCKIRKVRGYKKVRLFGSGLGLGLGFI